MYILIFLQRAPMFWYSKRQNIAETSTFGSEFVVMKTAIEQVEALRHKLRMLGREGIVSLELYKFGTTCYELRFAFCFLLELDCSSSGGLFWVLP